MTPPEPASQNNPKPTWIEWLTTTINGVAALTTAIGALIAAIVASWHLLAPDKGSTCQFADGWIDYAPRAELPIGSSCQDGSGGSGQVVVKGHGAKIPVATICQFANGWHDYSTISSPFRIGVQCQDGRGGVGQVVSKGTGPQI